MTPTVRSDYRTRVIAFATPAEAHDEMKAWQAMGFRARIIVRKDVANVLVSG